ncbi:hypothetical protein CcaverHIS002_0206350 [Cutaneotrichosporon cavernicola]|uniref:Yeast cell wall synthesis Kre9/Knh1-like N-terminal domain-containing protein n=1 Tax=Cutaneotrichosporon cavernicola TaxID=279322 RepID=A0AA48L199_9TREE|nr:uncharacterized protein CcaverHIS019_0206320 [Cutaneotrichosporon cavernicola]BEI81475.1 hypothetical protein CcaverHIS002_0206350 [Cutaneotrichosporon cavernicola]BEI89270.1 hypothetical protein CcaverHIS019_0206320 [Cutaneotrichosporon cavernicola]BEI97046.1 hypothetical protein CcaverHIS631_0206350 [Cutaneotrichosporon cavernicola]BEJ04819.1 hypothetical protein CcaverHIS641_0206360 [Cutaneotrichosporon cavernicola]
MFVAALLALAAPALATIYTTNPVASTSVKGGEVLEIKWQDDGIAPTLDTIGTCSVDLCIGSPTKQLCIQNLAESVDVSKASTVSTTIDPSIGANYDAYFIRYSAENYTDKGMPYMQFSARFALTDMAGNFTAEQQTYADDKSTTTSGSVSISAKPSSSAAPSSSSSKPSSSAAPSSASATKPASSTTASPTPTPNSGVAGLIAPAGLAIAAAMAAYIAL